MKTVKAAKIMLASLACCFSSVALSDSFLSGNSITNTADSQVVTAINANLGFASSMWSMLAAYYSQTSGFPPAGTFDIASQLLPNGVTIVNNSNGILVLTFGSIAPGPLANNSFALTPTCVSLRGNTFYVYELPQCFTNIVDSVTTSGPPQPGTAISVFAKSNLGIKCVYAASPEGAALNAANNCNSSPSTALNNGI